MQAGSIFSLPCRNEGTHIEISQQPTTSTLTGYCERKIILPPTLHVAKSPPATQRYAVLRLLGRGTQGSVHLAFDQRLKRDVAVKRVLKGAAGAGLVPEAQAVSRLQHPNIVSLHDAFSEDEADVLVFEYVAGETLSALIKRRKGPAGVPESLNVVKALLAGLQYAHESGVVHCDVKPANVIINQNGVPRLTDFGIAIEVGAKSDGVACTGTPAYLAPEIAAGRAPSPRSDVFSAGVVLYELLSGTPPVVGSNTFEVIHRMATETFLPPSANNPGIDPRLDQMVMRAIAKRPEDRFDSAKAFADAINVYLSGDASVPDWTGGSATVDFLLQRMRIKGDFPALGEAISAINRIAASETQSINALTAVILKDVSLTNKLLRMVNTVCYKRFGGSVSTISRAVTILGFDAVRNSALSLILFEHLINAQQRGELQRLVAGSYFASEIARDLVGHMGSATPEEGSIAAMFFELGRLLVTFYLFEEAQQIARRALQLGADEDKAAREVIGITYAGLGTAVAKRWGFPDTLVDALSRFDTSGESRGKQSDLRAVADCSNALAHCDSPLAFEKLAHRFKHTLGITAGRLESLRQTCLERTVGEAAQIGLDLTAFSPVISAATGAKLEALPTADLAGRAGTDSPIADAEQQSLLVSGIRDISQTLAGDFELLDVMRIIVETLYRGGSFQRVMLFIKDPAGTKLICRIGFGVGSDHFVQERFSLSLAPARDVFFGCLSRNADLLINDTSCEKISGHLPDGYHKLFGAQSALLLPICAQKVPLGLLYADTLDRKSGDLPRSQMDLLRTLRSQALLAMKQKGIR